MTDLPAVPAIDGIPLYASEKLGEGCMSGRAGRAEHLNLAKVERRFALVPESVTEARGLVEEIADRIDPGLVEDLRVVVSELVTNVYKHSGLVSERQVVVRLEVVSAVLVRGEAEDSSPGFEVPPLLTPEPDALDGRGLYLIDKLVQHWGVQTEGGLTRTWFEMDASVPHGSTRSV